MLSKKIFVGPLDVSPFSRLIPLMTSAISGNPVGCNSGGKINQKCKNNNPVLKAVCSVPHPQNVQPKNKYHIVECSTIFPPRLKHFPISHSCLSPLTFYFVRPSPLRFAPKGPWPYRVHSVFRYVLLTIYLQHVMQQLRQH